MAAASDEIAIKFSLSEGQKHDAPEGRKLIVQLEKPTEARSLVMDRAYEDNETRELAVKQGYSPVVPPKKSRLEPWEYDKELYKRRNEVERLFRRLKGFRRVFTRYEKLDMMYMAFLTIALIYIAIK
jgi:transposase